MAGWKTIARFWLRMVCFLLILTVTLGYGLYVLTPKHDYGVCSITNLYQQEENTIDVLVLGTSMAYSAVNTNLLYAEHGIAAYNLCGAEMPYWISYYYLLEALKTQSPRVIVLDAQPATYGMDYPARGRIIMSTYGIRDPLTRLQAIADSTRPEEFLSYILGYPAVHSVYSDVTTADFAYPPTNGGRGPTWKGFIEYDETERLTKPKQTAWPTATRPLSAKQQLYFEKILTLANERGINVLVVGFPTPDFQNDAAYYNTLRTIAESHQAMCVNYNQPDYQNTWDYARDFADRQHLNLRGSAKLTGKLARDLQIRYSLPDRRGDAAYSSYETCAAQWFALYPQYQPEE